MTCHHTGKKHYREEGNKTAKKIGVMEEEIQVVFFHDISPGNLPFGKHIHIFTDIKNNGQHHNDKQYKNESTQVLSDNI